MHANKTGETKKSDNDMHFGILMRPASGNYVKYQNDRDYLIT